MKLWPYSPNDNAQWGINPPISDSATFSFDSAKSMVQTFEGEREDLFLYSRHSSPTNARLEQALAALEQTEAAVVFGSGMGAISATLLQLCQQGDHIVASRTIYGGTYAFMKYFLPKLGIETTFVDTNVPAEVNGAIQKNTRLVYCETMSNPMLRITNIGGLACISKENGLALVVDNTFTPLMVQPAKLGADVVIHSLTKFINGNSDCIAGVVCCSAEMAMQMKDVNTGAAMLMGSTLDSSRAANILKNLQTLDIRMRKHSENAGYLARGLEKLGYRVTYPGLRSHPDHDLMRAQHQSQYGFGGLFTLEVDSFEQADALMMELQEQGLGHLAVSLGHHQTLFSASGTSTSSEIPENERLHMGLSDGLIRFSIGLDSDIESSFMGYRQALKKLGITSWKDSYSLS